MRKHFYILIFSIILTACDQNRSTADNKKGDSLTTKVTADTLTKDKEKAAGERMSFKNIAEVVQGKESKAWVELRDSSVSLALHFNLGYKDTLSVSYSSECWLMYPFKTENDRIIVYWDTFVDTKYDDFDIVEAIETVPKKYVGKPFMILELVNDTTLKATYPIPGLIEKINSSSKDRTLFPNKYVVSQKFYL